MKSLKLSKRWAQLGRWIRFSGVIVALAGSAITVVMLWPHASVALANSNNYPPQLRMSYSRVVQAVRTLGARQDTSGVRVVSQRELDQYLSRIQVDATSGKFALANSDIASLQKALIGWNQELGDRTATPSPVAAAQVGSAPVAAGVRLPILLYHYPPANFEQQLQHLQAAGYTSIDLDQALAGLHGGALPAKPVVITFDDGFSAQMSAVDALVRHHMKATFYIIDAGEASKWCIGAGRRFGDPLQPPGGCGDSYLSWDQVRQIDRTGLIAIGGHTVNHRNLASLSYADQQFEIATGKQELEKQLGHSIRHFAYPYGAYNAQSIEIARAAGYTTATTTAAGDIQAPGSDFTLRRVRDAMILP